MDNSKNVYRAVRKIPRGKVMTYGQIGKILGINPRLVGLILHKNNDPDHIPCHRVVNAKGGVAKGYAFGGEKVQKERLEFEGVTFKDDKVILKKHLLRDRRD